MRINPEPEAIESRTIERDGFTIIISHLYDQDSRPDYLGSYSETPAAGAIDRVERGDIPGRHREGNKSRFFNPGESGAEYVEEDYARAESWGRDEWWYVGIIAAAYRQGVKLGLASVWGFESDSEDGYLRAEEDSIADEAISDAKKVLAELCCGNGGKS